MIGRAIQWLSVIAYAQIVALAQDTPFTAPVAHPLEARVGTIIQPGKNSLRLDIGARADIMEVFADTANGTMRIGADFMTYTRLRSEGNFKFPVETSDYFFGLSSSWKQASGPWSVRLRLAHISSHLVDGSADSSGRFETQRPFVYSREFAELLTAYQVGALRPYGGLTAVWARQPRDANVLIPQLGCDVNMSLGKGLELRGGYDWKLIGISGIYVTSQAAQLGVFADLWNGRGILVSAYGFNGRSMHGMFYKQPDSYLGLGFQLIW